MGRYRPLSHLSESLQPLPPNDSCGEAAVAMQVVYSTTPISPGKTVRGKGCRSVSKLFEGSCSRSLSQTLQSRLGLPRQPCVRGALAQLAQQRPGFGGGQPLQNGQGAQVAKMIA